MEKIFIIASGIILSLAIFGCSAEQYGAGINKEVQTVKVKDILLDPSMNGKVVNLEGIITTQCPKRDGCWFFLHDGTGQIFISLRPDDFTMPQRIRKKAKVTGLIQHTPQGVQIIAYGVEIR